MLSNTEIGDRIYTTRISRGLTLDDIASRVGVAKSTIQRYEKGTIQKIKMPVIESIAYVLNVNPNWLIGNIDEPSRQEKPDAAEEFPEIIMVARAGRKMTQQNREDMIKILRIAFPDAFSEDD